MNLDNIDTTNWTPEQKLFMYKHQDIHDYLRHDMSANVDAVASRSLSLNTIEDMRDALTRDPQNRYVWALIEDEVNLCMPIIDAEFREFFRTKQYHIVEKNKHDEWVVSEPLTKNTWILHATTEDEAELEAEPIIAMRREYFSKQESSDTVSH